MRHSSTNYYSGSLLAFAGTLSIHAFLLAPILFGGPALERHHRPKLEGFGATVTGEQAEVSDAMILLDLAGLTSQSEASLAGAASSGLRPTEGPLLIAIPDPLPVFDSIDEANASETAPPAKPASNIAGRALLVNGYMGQISARVNRAWRRPRNPLDNDRFDCLVRIQQSTAGMVESVELIQCNGDSNWQESLVSAIERAAPLSAPPEPDVFSSQIVLSFSSPTYLAGVSREDEYAPETARLATGHP